MIEVSEDSINSIEKVEEWKVLANGNRMPNGASPRENGKFLLQSVFAMVISSKRINTYMDKQQNTAIFDDHGRRIILIKVDF